MKNNAARAVLVCGKQSAHLNLTNQTAIRSSPNFGVIKSNVNEAMTLSVTSEMKQKYIFTHLPLKIILHYVVFKQRSEVNEPYEIKVYINPTCQSAWAFTAGTA